MKVVAKKYSVYIVPLIFLVFVTIRMINLGGASNFIVAGTDFYDSNIWGDKIQLNEGQGYDGQFFFRYALNPCATEDISGIKVDLPPYRHQRIMYPSLSWLLSLGKPQLLPFVMILVNFLAIIGSCVFLKKLATRLKIDNRLALLPILISGVFMVVARDLAEVLALFFLLASVYFIIFKKLWWFALTSALGVLTREPEIIIYLGLIVTFIIPNRKKPKILLPLISPIAVLFFWKLYMGHIYPNYSAPVHNLTWPTWGVFKSLIINFKGIDDLRGAVEFTFWLTNISIYFYIFYITIKLLIVRKEILANPLGLAILIAVTFSLFFSEAIFIDDWAFGRVLITTVALCIIYLFWTKTIHKMNLLFLLFFSSLTFARLIILT